MNGAAWFAAGFATAGATLMVAALVGTFIDRARRLADRGGPR